VGEEQSKFELVYNERDFTKIFFGDSIVKTFFDRARTQSIVIATVLGTIVFLLWKYYSRSHLAIILMLVLAVVLAFTFFRTLHQFSEFYKWRLLVLDYAKRGNIFKNSTITLYDEVLNLQSAAGKEVIILAYDKIMKLDKNENRIFLYEGGNEALCFPSSSFESQEEFEEFCIVLEKKILKSKIR